MQPGPIAIGWLLAAALLLVEHIGLWGQTWRLKNPWTYLVGVLTLAVGWIAWAMTAVGPVTPIDAVANIGAVSSAGAVVLVAYYVRGRLAQRDAQAAQQGEIIGMARGLHRELKERADRGENDPGRSN
ncbi:MAG TPA: hypothetical protein VFU22_16530 [Roseiflexaceae bacterium]|nr:hypothetical protein [Roseiflexaceae bacterium]